MRYEIKYAIENLAYPEVYSELLHHPFSFTKLYDDRVVNNIYLDTPQLGCFYQNVDGIPHRQKVRLRWYGNKSVEKSKTTLEIKIKNNELGYKKIYDIDNAIYDKTGLITCIKKLGYTYSHLVPTLNNSYLRSYLISHCRRYRITIDRNQHFDIPFRTVKSNLHISSPIIVELKYDKQYQSSANHVKQFMKFRQTKNSKYVNGIMLLNT